MNNMHPETDRGGANEGSSVGKALLWFACVSSVLMLVLVIFRIELAHLLSVFILPYVALVVVVAFLGSTVVSTVYVCRRRRFRSIRSYIPLAVHMLTVVILLKVPFDDIKIDLDYRLNRARRMEVVRMIESGELTEADPERPGLISLPRGYRGTSKGGGDVLVERTDDATYVLFFFYRGILGHFSGVMYRSDDSEPEEGDFGGEYVQILRNEENWYWVVAGK